MGAKEIQPLNPEFAPVYWNVMCWVDSVEAVDPAMGIALLLACRKAGTVHVVLGLDSPNRYRKDPSVGMERVEPLTPELIDRMSTSLASLYANMGGDAVNVHTMVLPGHPVEEVRRYAQHHEIDLIVIGDQALRAEEAFGKCLLSDPPCQVVLAASGKKLLSHLSRKE